MLSIEATVNLNGKDKIFDFSTNDSGMYLFAGYGAVNQISTNYGYNSLRKIKKAAADIIRFQYGDQIEGKIKYRITLGKERFIK